MPSSLRGKVAIVTGGSRGIGLATASALLAEGVHVAVSGLNPRRLAEAEAQLGRVRAKGADLLAVEADVRDHAAVEALVEATVRRFGGLDILVNNAGVGRFADVAAQSVEDWRRVIDTNLTGVFYCCRAAIPHLLRRGGGWIVNISSLAGKNPFAGAAAYCASKAGLDAFSEALVQEVRYENIRVSHVVPGQVDTEFTGPSEAPGTDWKLLPEDVARVVLDIIAHDRRSLPSRVELRPAKPRR